MRHARHERRGSGRPRRRGLVVALLGLSLIAPAATASQAAGDDAPSLGVEATAEPADPAASTPVPSDPATSGSPEAEQRTDVTESPVEPREPAGDVDPTVEERPAVAPRATVSPMAVPSPSGDESVVTVKVGSRHGGGAGIVPVEGVELALFDRLDALEPVKDVWARCTSDAAGDCSFTIPDTDAGLFWRGKNWDRELYVKALRAPGGYRVLGQLGVGDGATGLSTYGFRVGEEVPGWLSSSWQLRAGKTYRSTSHFMGHADAKADQVSSGWLPMVRDNEELAPQCGLDVALVLDLSGSIAGHENSLSRAASALVDGLTGTPSSVALFSFSTGSPATVWANGRDSGRVILPNHPEPQQVATVDGANRVKSWYSTSSGTASFAGSGGTNWDRALSAPATSAHDYDVAIVVTDGSPTFFGPASGTGNVTRFVDLEHCIFSANAIKERGTRVIAMGVGSGVGSTASGLNLQAISGTQRGADYFQTTNYDDAAAQLRELALGSCHGSVSVVKEVVPHTTTGEDVTGSQPASGWTFSAAATHPEVQVPASGATDDTGAVNFPITYPRTGVVTGLRITEQQQDGYSLVTQNGSNAVCRHLGTGASVPVTNVRDGFVLTGITAADPISCTVYNREPAPHATLTVDKQWVVDGEVYAHADRPEGWDAQLVLSEDRAAWGTRYDGYVAGDVVTVAERAGSLPALCTLESTELTREGGDVRTLPASGTQVELGSGANHYTVTNTVSCTQQLTLAAEVGYGSAPADSWTLSATSGRAIALRGPDGVSGEVDHTEPYELAEEGGPREYVQEGEWRCLTSEGDGVPVDDGTVRVPRGTSVTCTVTTVTATLTLLKHVEDADPATGFVPSAWTLTATPDGGAGLAVPVVTGGTEVTDANTVAVRPGHRYTLSEALTGEGNPLAYRHLALERYVGESPEAPELDPCWAAVDAAAVTLSPRTHEVYRFVNAPVPAPALPLTGGLGPTTYLATGGVLLALALGAGTLHRVRSRRATSPSLLPITPLRPTGRAMKWRET